MDALRNSTVGTFPGSLSQGTRSQATVQVPGLKGDTVSTEAVSKIAQELADLRREFSQFKRTDSASPAPPPQTAPPQDPGVGSNGGFSPGGPAYSLPAYASAVAFESLNMAHHLGGGMALHAANSSGMLNGTQSQLTQALHSLGQNQGLAAGLPVLGGLAAGMLLLKGFHGYCSAQALGSKSGQVLGALDIAASVSMVASAITGLEIVGAIGAVVSLGARFLVSSPQP